MRKRWLNKYGLTPRHFKTNDYMTKINFSEYILFDTGALNRVLKSEHTGNFIKNYESFLVDKIGKKISSMGYLTTPSLVIEILGLSNQIRHPDLEMALNSISPEKQFESIFFKALEHYKKVFTLDLLLINWKRQQPHFKFHGHQRQLIEDTIQRALDTPEFLDDALWSLAWKYSQRENLYPKFLDIADHIFFNCLVFRKEHQRDCPIYPAAHYCAKHYKEWAKNRPELLSGDELFWSTLSIPDLKIKDDYLDGEMIHYSLLGIFEEAQTMTPVTVITTENNFDRMRLKLKIARQFYGYGSLIAKHKKTEYILDDQFAPGRILFIDYDSGEFKHEISCENLIQ